MPVELVMVIGAHQPTFGRYATIARKGVRAHGRRDRVRPYTTCSPFVAVRIVVGSQSKRRTPSHTTHPHHRLTPRRGAYDVPFFVLHITFFVSHPLEKKNRIAIYRYAYLCAVLSFKTNPLSGTIRVFRVLTWFRGGF